ncbi:MAG: HEAT repeat domain-containing protein [Acidobacteriota bacterium]|nr:HEAT repeat domain-containing protein [Acidobacteriota bacterium]
MNESPNVRCIGSWALLLLLLFAGALRVVGQTPAPGGTSKADGAMVGDNEPVQVALPAAATPEARAGHAWTVLKDAVHDTKHSQTRIQALAALGMLRNEQSAKLISDGMNDPDLDVRTAAVLAAGQTMDRNLTTDVRALLDDKEPQVAFTSASTLWKMGDRSGEDILMAVVDGDRSASPTLLHGTGHQINRELHNPTALARIGAMQGASMLLGPFGFGITAYEYVRRNGGDLARVSAIELIAQNKTEPIHRELVAALTDKDPAVRAASAKALSDYHDGDTGQALFPLLADPKYPVRLTAAAAYLRTTGVPGPLPMTPPAAPKATSKGLKSRR